MCNLARLGVIAALAAGVSATPACVGAQAARTLTRAAEPRPLVDAYRARRAEFHRRMAVERDSMARLGAIERAAYSVAAVRGRLTVLTSVAFVDSAAHALAVADSLLGSSAFARASDQPVTLRLHPGWGVEAGDTIHRVTWFLDRLAPDGGERVLDWWPRLPAAATLGENLAFKEQERLRELLPPALQSWLNGQIAPLDFADRWRNVYIALATSASVISSSCLLGNLPACRQVLLVDRPADPLMEWFTPSARRGIVRPLIEPQHAAEARRVDALVPGGITACLTGGDDDACVKVIRSGEAPDIVKNPLGSAAGREALLIAAVEMPGAPGLRAIMGRPALGLNESLAAISGTTVDAVVRHWHERVVASEPETVQLTAPRLLSALAWTLACCIGALGGSRWRST